MTSPAITEYSYSKVLSSGHNKSQWGLYRAMGTCEDAHKSKGSRCTRHNAALIRSEQGHVRITTEESVQKVIEKQKKIIKSKGGKN